MGKVKYIVLAIIGIIILIVVALFYRLGSIEVRQTKDYAKIYVDETVVLDGEAIISPPDEYAQLLQIDLEMRERLAEYMKENNYKLKSGKQEFIRNNPSFEELVENGFKFEKIE